MRKAMNIICGILAELCALAVIFLGAYLAYDAKASSLDQSYVSHRQEQVSHRKIHKATPGKTATMRHTDPPAEAEPGDGELFAYLRVPSWGKQYRLPIWQGTAKTVLDEMGAGHYDTTAMPGQVGNSSLAGHNTYADMADIRLLKPGDVVYIETGSYWYRYRINSNPEIVDQSRTDVIDQDAAGVERGLTLQTCWPIMTGGNVTHRLIVHGGLDGWAPKTDGTPAEYTETTDTTIDKISRRIVTVSEKKNLPVTGVLGICAFIIWILLDTIGWMCSHRRMTCYWHGRDIGGPITWLWRLNAGIMPSNTIVFIITRTIVFLMDVDSDHPLPMAMGVPATRLHTFPHLMTNQNGKESHGKRRTRHGTRPPAAGDSQRPRRIRQRAAHSPRTGATTHEQACHRRMAARRRPRRCRNHRTEDTIGNQSMQPVHGTTREHRGPRKPVQGGLRMPQGRKRPRRRQHCLDLRRPR